MEWENQLSGGRIPDQRALVAAGRHNVLPVRAEIGLEYLFSMFRDLSGGMNGLRTSADFFRREPPKDDSPIETSRGEPIPVGVEGCRGDRAPVPELVEGFALLVLIGTLRVEDPRASKILASRPARHKQKILARWSVGSKQDLPAH